MKISLSLICTLFTLIALGLAFSPIRAEDNTILVSTAKELKQALQAAQPGQTIQLADGLYEGKFTASVSGSVTQPLTLRGSQFAILNGRGTTRGHVFYFEQADYWILSGFTLQNAQKGIMLDGADYKICNNRFDANGLSGENFADSWVDIKGNNYWVARR